MHGPIHKQRKSFGALESGCEESHHFGAWWQDVDATIVYGVNHQNLNGSHTVISAASCTTTLPRPMVKPLHQKIGVERGLMMQTLDLADRILVEFNGGETFLNFPVFEYLVERISQTAFPSGGSEVFFTVQSNGTLIRPKIAAFLREYNVNLGISLDGPAALHDRNRFFPNGRGSSAIILRNLQLLRDFGVDFGLLSVIERPEDVRPVYDFLLDQDPSMICLNLRRVNGRSESHISDDDLVAIAQEHYQVFRDSLRQHVDHARAPKLANLCHMIESILMYIPAYMCMRNPCGAGLDQVVFDYEGNVWPCQEFTGDERFRVGIGHGMALNQALSTNTTVMAMRRRRLNDLDECRDCNWLHYCQGGCFATTYVAEDRDFEKALTKKTPHCAYYKYMFAKLIWDVYCQHDSVVSYAFCKDRGFIEHSAAG
jgi:uncharacterized protein